MVDLGMDQALAYAKERLCILVYLYFTRFLSVGFEPRKKETREEGRKTEKERERESGEKSVVMINTYQPMIEETIDPGWSQNRRVIDESRVSNVQEELMVDSQMCLEKTNSLNEERNNKSIDVCVWIIWIQEGVEILSLEFELINIDLLNLHLTGMLLSILN